jgi:hypothetical protein
LSDESEKGSNVMHFQVNQVIDSQILANSFELVQNLLKKTQKDTPQYQKIIDFFPQLLEYVRKSEDMFFILHGTSAIRSFIHIGSKEIKKM